MSYSCNNNQNYFIQNNRSTSRVLQPPGGASSFSLGGYETAPVRSVPNNRNRHPSPCEDINTGNKKMSNNSNNKRRDSLDDLMKGCEIPGLENHYSKGHSKIKNDMKSSDKSYRRNVPPSSDCSGGAYTTESQSFNQKSSLQRENSGRSQSKYSENSKPNTEPAPALALSQSTRIRLPPGGNSTFSLNWS